MQTVIGLVLAAILLSACAGIPVMGSGRLISASRDVSGYTRVEISGGGDAEIIQDGTQALTIQTDDNVMPYVTAEVRGDTLHLGLDFGGLRSITPTRLHFTIHVKELSGLTTSGSWTITSAAIQSQSLTLVISGSGKIRIDSLQAQALNATVSGSGELDLAGQAAHQNITVSGSGNILAGDLMTGSSQVRISGSREATLWATDVLGVNISGSGDVGYYGSPQVSVSRSGSGKVHSLGVK